jgi:hypothetical protein
VSFALRLAIIYPLKTILFELNLDFKQQDKSASAQITALFLNRPEKGTKEGKQRQQKISIFKRA